MHQSDLKIKDHLIKKLNELESQTVEKSTELLFEKKRVKELLDDKRSYDEQMEKT